jgi:hypothetical protein
MPEKTATKYLVTHSNLDDHVQGDVIDSSYFDAREGADVQRLVRLGAIREMKQGEDASGDRYTALTDAANPNVDAAGVPLAPGQSLDPTVTRPTASEQEAATQATDEELRARREASVQAGQQRAAQPASPEELAAAEQRYPTSTQPDEAPLRSTQANPPTQSAYDRMSVGSLQEIAAQHGVEGAASMKKAELIAAIERAQNAP